jgi:hypothetical protein
VKRLVKGIRVARFPAFVAIFVGLPWAPVVHSREQPTSVSCNGPEYRQFDFWVGDWDVVDRDRPTLVIARARVELILDNCVLHERYEQTDGKKGESFSMYDSTRNRWHQSWVTNRGELLMIDGQLGNGILTLAGSDIGPDGNVRKVRGSWQRVDEGVREVASRSADGGVSWIPWFDLIFRKHQP